MREFSALMDRFREREELAFLRTAQICSMIANSNRCDSDGNQLRYQTPEPFTPQDFMPGHNKQPEPEMTDAQKAAEWNLRMSVINASFGGKDLTNG